MMRWYPDRTPDPRPIHGWGERLDPSVVADVTFQDTDDPEGAQAWLDAQMSQNLRETDAVTESIEQRYRDDLERLGRYEREQARLQSRIQALPDGQIWVRADSVGPVAHHIGDGRWTIREDPRQLSGEELAARTRRVYPAGCFQDPPTDQPVERPDFPSAPITGVESVRLIIRMANGVEEIFEIDDPAEVRFRPLVDQEWVEVGEPQRRMIPGLRELRNVLVSIASPRNWRRLPTRRWR